MKTTCIIKSLFLFCLLGAVNIAIAQQEDTTNSDGLFQAARKAAFDKKDYATAKAYCYKALNMSPGYADIRIFLGRIYAWTDNFDSAVYCFEYVLKDNPSYEDNYLAYSDLLYWNNQYLKGLEICNTGLSHHPQSNNLLLRKAKHLNQLANYKEAYQIVQQILTLDKNNTEARALAGRLRELSAKNRIGVSYDYTYFNKQFDDPWHLVAVDYSRVTKLGSIAARLNYANRFKESALQYEFDAYPRISKTFYSYASIAFSDTSGVFPKFRAGFSLYANLPKSFEAEAGFRYLKFDTETWIYTLYLGKYVSNWLVYARTYLTPGQYEISQSYNVGARYYYKGNADEFVWLNIGTGISPDDRSLAQQLDADYKLVTQRASVSWRFAANKFNFFTASAGWIHQEYFKDTYGNQIELGLAFIHRF
jgi:YaiO family outer membrane protein